MVYVLVNPYFNRITFVDIKLAWDNGMLKYNCATARAECMLQIFENESVRKLCNSSLIRSQSLSNVVE